MDRLAAYNKLNKSFHKKYVFNFGSEGGFYSEFNNMVFGMIYCLKYQYQFVLYSGNSQFKTNKGWDDFFVPFCPSVDTLFHKRFNKRITARKLKPKHYPEWYAFKLFNKDTYLTYQLFHQFFNKDFEQEQFDFPELDLKGSLRDVARGIVEMIYRFNEATQAGINDIIAKLKLPAKYVSVNIRRGDKDTEFNYVSASGYLQKLGELSNIKDVFVLTDDYRVIEDLQKEYSAFTFYTLVKPDERGYVHHDFIKQDEDRKKNDMIKLFASMEIMRRSELVVGTFTVNPGTFLGMTMPEDKFISVQKKSWYQFQDDDIQNKLSF